jgi:hypothetical protein
MSPIDMLTPSGADGTAAYAVTLADGSTQINVGESVTLRASSTVRRSRMIRWSSSNSSIVSVSSSGTITGRAAGAATVTARGSNGSWSQFRISVVSTTTRTAPVVAVVDIAVPSPTMTVAGTMTLTATAWDSAGVAITGRTVAWSALGTAVTVSSTGVVTAVAAGSGDVRATVDGVTAARTITVAAPTVASLTISPKTGATLAPGATRQFSTTATWSDLATRAVGVTYTATGGTISSSGLYTAGQLIGSFMVIANCGCGRADTAAVSIAAVVVPAQLTRLTISPKTATVNAGATQQFAATANWSTGATSLPPIAYSATGGVVTSAGLWTAPSTSGTYKVILAHSGGTLRDTATVTVQGTTVVAPPANGVAVVFSDDFESGGFTTTQNGVRWTALPWIEMASGFARRGSKSMAFKQGDSKEWAEAQFGGLPRLSEVFLQYWLYQPNGAENPSVGPDVVVPGARNDKFFRLWGGTYTGVDDIKFGASTWNGRLGVEYKRNALNGTLWAMGEGGDPISPEVVSYHSFIGNSSYKGRWVRIRIQARAATPGVDNGVIKMWLDDSLILSRERLRAYAAGAGKNYFEAGYLLGWAANTFPVGQRMYLDDFSISTGGFPQ